MGAPEGFVHVIHSEDVGGAVDAALSVPSGVYNVGAEPVRRADLVAGYAEAAGQEHGSFVGPLITRLAGDRLEPLARSLRISSDRFAGVTGWAPRRSTFGADWLDAARTPEVTPR
jgi:nucleoside-diphosphate-sugar epimerase